VKLRRSRLRTGSLEGATPSATSHQSNRAKQTQQFPWSWLGWSEHTMSIEDGCLRPLGLGNPSPQCKRFAAVLQACGPEDRAGAREREGKEGGKGLEEHRERAERKNWGSVSFPELSASTLARCCSDLLASALFPSNLVTSAAATLAATPCTAAAHCWMCCASVSPPSVPHPYRGV
jgi:hypothetical protein